MASLSVQPTYDELREEIRELRRENFQLVLQCAIYKKNIKKIDAAFYHMKVASVRAYDVMTEILPVEASDVNQNVPAVDQHNGE